MSKKIAKVISTIGNPLSLGVFFGIYLFFIPNNDDEKFKELPLIFSLFVVLPIVIFILVQTYITKRYSNLDVSNQEERKSLYRFIILDFSILNLYLIFNNFPIKAILVSVFLWLQITLSYFINFLIKISQHAAFSFLFSALFFPINREISLFLFFFSFLNAYSRVVLGRHSYREILAGSILGMTLGLLYLGCFYKLALV